MLLVIYDSISGNTEKMAEFIAEGARKKLSSVTVKRVNNVVEQDLIEAEAIAFGCPTYHRDLTPNMKNFFVNRVIKVKSSLKGKAGVAFGAYGWSGEAIKMMKETIQYLDMKVLDLDQDSTGTPDENFYLSSLSEIKGKCLKFGENLAKNIIKHK